MKLGKITLAILGLAFVGMSCESDDNGATAVPDRDRAEVYAEDIAEIEEYLRTHFYNYEDFDFGNPYSLANDTFEIVFDTIEGTNADKTPLMDQVSSKQVTDSEGQEYTLYYLDVREGRGNEVHFIDKAHVSYKGSKTDGDVFDSAVTPISFNLTTVSTLSGVVQGFRDGLVEFKTADSYSDNGDGTVTYHNHGIGAVFIPSGLGYFSTALAEIPSYTPLIFRFNVIDNTVMDHDADGIPSFIEDLNNDGDAFDNDSDEDSGADFIDNDDDNDDTLTRDEVEVKSYDEDDSMMPFMTRDAAQTYFNDNASSDEHFISIDFNEGGTYTLNTVVLTDSNNDGTPDYLDENISE